MADPTPVPSPSPSASEGEDVLIPPDLRSLLGADPDEDAPTRAD